LKPVLVENGTIYTFSYTVPIGVQYISDLKGVI